MTHFRYFVLLAHMRTGSNLFEEMMAQNANISMHGELFNPSFIKKKNTLSYLGFDLSRREHAPFDLIRAIQEDSAPHLAGFRLFYEHDTRVLRHVLQDPGCAKIILRRNLLDSYVSQKIAQETGQWKLASIFRRKSAKITFDLQEFRQYYDNLTNYYQYIDDELLKSGQAALRLSYENLHDPQTYQAVQNYLGLTTAAPLSKASLIRQNPERLSDKVANFGQMLEDMRSLDPFQTQEQSHYGANRSQNAPPFFASKSKPILYQPVSGTHNHMIFNWLAAHETSQLNPNDYAPQPQKPALLQAWRQSQTQAPISFTVIEHPLRRIYACFCTHILSNGPQCYRLIRNKLISQYQLPIPRMKDIHDADRDKFIQFGYNLEAHKTAFYEFLCFLKLNLNDQTSIRKDHSWVPQADLIVRAAEMMPITHVFTPGRLENGLNFIENELGLPPHSRQLSKWAEKRGDAERFYPLNAVLTPEIESLAQDLYASDYDRFGFEKEGAL